LLRLAPARVVVLGGPAAVEDAVVAAVADALPGASVERRFGPTRYETAVAVSAATFGAGPDTVWIVTGSDFPDALVAAPVAAIRGEPLLLVERDTIPAAVVDELDRLSPNRIVVVGGTAAVSEAVEAELGAHAGIVSRLSAPDRYALSALVAATQLPNANNVYVATGERFPDALAAGPLAAAGQGPILLVRSDAVPSGVAEELQRVGRLQLIVLGGPAAVSELVLGDLATYL
jgi:putative cell wall-binding protein